MRKMSSRCDVTATTIRRSTFTPASPAASTASACRRSARSCALTLASGPQRLEDQHEVVRAAGQRRGVADGEAHVDTRLRGVAPRVGDRAGIEVDAVDLRVGNARATAMLDQPWPQPTSAAREPGARRRAATSGIASSHSVGSSLVKAGRLMWPWPWRNSTP